MTHDPALWLLALAVVVWCAAPARSAWHRWRRQPTVDPPPRPSLTPPDPLAHRAMEPPSPVAADDGRVWVTAYRSPPRK